MGETPTTPTPPQPEQPRKMCLISLMFPVEDDTVAMGIKAKIDEALPDVTDKRYTFQIIEK